MSLFGWCCPYYPSNDHIAKAMSLTLYSLLYVYACEACCELSGTHLLLSLPCSPCMALLWSASPASLWRCCYTQDPPLAIYYFVQPMHVHCDGLWCTNRTHAYPVCAWFSVNTKVNLCVPSSYNFPCKRFLCNTLSYTWYQVYHKAVWGNRNLAIKLLLTVREVI